MAWSNSLTTTSDLGSGTSVSSRRVCPTMRPTTMVVNQPNINPHGRLCSSWSASLAAIKWRVPKKRASAMKNTTDKRTTSLTARRNVNWYLVSLGTCIVPIVLSVTSQTGRDSVCLYFLPSYRIKLAVLKGSPLTVFFSKEHLQFS